MPSSPRTSTATINKDSTRRKRFVGKTGILSLGYGSRAGVPEHVPHSGQRHPDRSEATSIVCIYRQMFKAIVEQLAVRRQTDAAADRRRGQVRARSCQSSQHRTVRAAGRHGQHNAMHLPNGNRLRYRDLGTASTSKSNSLPVDVHARHAAQKIYGAKLVENVVQALAFVHIMEVAQRVQDITDGQLAGASGARRADLHRRREVRRAGDGPGGPGDVEGPGMDAERAAGGRGTYRLTHMEQLNR